MARGHYRETPINSFGENGIYNKNDWLREANLHLLAAKMLRECSADSRTKISTMPNSGDQREQRADRLEFMMQREAGNKSSILLMGYAFEMLLKAGLVCLYVGVPRQAFLQDTKRRFGHKLRDIAGEIEVPLDGRELSRLDLLSGWVIGDARYPVTPHSKDGYSQQWNGLIREFWDDAKFAEWLALYEKIRLHVSALDASEDDPRTLRKWEIDDDGYVIYRIGGRLNPRITVHFSSVQKKNGDNKESLKKLMLDSIAGPFNRYLSRDWDTAVYREMK